MTARKSAKNNQPSLLSEDLKERLLSGKTFSYQEYCKIFNCANEDYPFKNMDLTSFKDDNMPAKSKHSSGLKQNYSIKRIFYLKGTPDNVSKAKQIAESIKERYKNKNVQLEIKAVDVKGLKGISKGDFLICAGRFAMERIGKISVKTEKSGIPSLDLTGVIKIGYTSKNPYNQALNAIQKFKRDIMIVSDQYENTEKGNGGNQFNRVIVLERNGILDLNDVNNAKAMKTIYDLLQTLDSKSITI